MFFMQMYKIFWHCRYFMVKIIEQGKKSISLYGLILYNVFWRYLFQMIFDIDHLSIFCSVTCPMLINRSNE